MSTAIYFSANAGVAGDLYGLNTTVIESWDLDPLLVPVAFGLPMKIVAGKIAAIESGDAATDFYGILSRSAPTSDGSLQVQNQGQPNVNTTVGIVVGGPGYVLVKCTVGDPVRGGDVYMRITEVGLNLVGDLEADADGANNVLLTDVVWGLSSKDGNNVTGLRVK